MKTKYLLSFTIALLFLLINALSAAAFDYKIRFGNITKNNETDAAIGEAQIYAEVEYDEIAGTVTFTFYNKGNEQCSITDIYFDDSQSSFFSSFTIDNSVEGVEFSADANPQNLPGAESFFSATFSADSDAGQGGVTQHGINNSDLEKLAITFVLNENMTYADLLNALLEQDGGFKIGLHVQGFNSGGSESFISNSLTSPIPGAVWLLGSGILGLAGIRLRSGRKRS